MQSLIKFHWFVHKILSGHQILTTNRGHNYVVNLQNWTRNNPNLDVVKVNAYAKFEQISSIRLQELERKQNPTIAKGHKCVLNLRK